MSDSLVLCQYACPEEGCDKSYCYPSSLTHHRQHKHGYNPKEHSKSRPRSVKKTQTRQTTNPELRFVPYTVPEHRASSSPLLAEDHKEKKSKDTSRKKGKESSGKRGQKTSASKRVHVDDASLTAPEIAPGSSLALGPGTASEVPVAEQPQTLPHGDGFLWATGDAAGDLAFAEFYAQFDDCQPEVGYAGTAFPNPSSLSPETPSLSPSSPAGSGTTDDTVFTPTALSPQSCGVQYVDNLLVPQQASWSLPANNPCPENTSLPYPFENYGFGAVTSSSKTQFHAPSPESFASPDIGVVVNHVPMPQAVYAQSVANVGQNLPPQSHFNQNHFNGTVGTGYQGYYNQGYRYNNMYTDAVNHQNNPYQGGDQSYTYANTGTSNTHFVTPTNGAFTVPRFYA